MGKTVCKVLFIGNSHTYCNDMVFMLKYLSEAQDSEVLIEPVMLAHPGRSLEEHKNEPEVRFNILYGGFDNIVLQQAAHPFPGKEALLRDALCIKEFIDQTNAVPIAFMTWAEKSKPENQEPMTEAYIELAKQMNGILAPIGVAWQRVIGTNPNLDLYYTDGEHANHTGSYLTACVFYTVITKKSPVGLPGKVLFRDRVICDISQEIALIMQRVAWETVQAFKDKTI